MTGLKWTHRTTEKIATQLRDTAGITISANTVARLLSALGYSLRLNCKKIALTSSPDRDEQFRYIAALRDRFERQRLPMISVDTKKKELIGAFKNGGRCWTDAPVAVNDHDFRSDAKGIAVPYGVYDLQANRGHMFIGTSHDTSAFAVDALVSWWLELGRGRYPGADRILVLADSGGSNGARVRAWKYELQTKLCNRFGIAVTVCHYPPGTSKWNPIDHRLFPEISKNWAGRPLESYQVVLNHIRTTRTKTGLSVTATFTRRGYSTGVKITDKQMSELNLEPHTVCPKLNYTLRPTRESRPRS